MKNLLVSLKILAAFAVAVTGILGIVGKSTDQQENITQYGWINLCILILP